MEGAWLDRLTERQSSMIGRLVSALSADERVVSCWLSGSLAGDEHDKWSDIDINAAVEPDDYERFLPRACELLLGTGHALMHWPGLATAEVSTFAAFFADGTYVDLHIHSNPRGATFLQHGPIRVLYGDTPSGAALQPGDLAERRNEVQHRLGVFWLQILFAAKYIERDDLVMAAGYLACSRGTLVQLLDLRKAHRLWTPPPVLWAVYGRLAENERSLVERTECEARAGRLRQALAALVGCHDKLLVPLALDAECAEWSSQMATTVQALLAE